MGKKKKVSDKELLKPLDILSLGGESDPCFGKEYDLTTNECQRCGDSELCAIANSQKLRLVREGIEREKDFKDIEKPKKSKIDKFIEKMIDKDYKPSKIITKTMKKFDLTKKEARSKYKSIK